VRAINQTRTAFFVHHAIVQDLQDEPTEPMRDRANRLRMAETDHEMPVQQLKDAALRLHRGVGGLIVSGTGVGRSLAAGAGGCSALDGACVDWGAS